MFNVSNIFQNSRTSETCFSIFIYFDDNRVAAGQRNQRSYGIFYKVKKYQISRNATKIPDFFISFESNKNRQFAWFHSLQFLYLNN